MKLRCTVRNCPALLEWRERPQLVCTNGHTFDMARSGYINLMQPQDSRAKEPGDTREAVAARRRFLGRGYADALVEAIVGALPLDAGQSLVDAGSGEGHHTNAFYEAYHVDACGVDISVPAATLAARRYGDCLWLIANADRFLPFPDGSIDAVTSITARLNPEEFRRILKPDGKLLVAIPAPDDVLELRAAILGDALERDRVERTVSMFAPLFALERHERVRHRVWLDREAISDVMASSYRGLRTRERERLEKVEPMEVTLSRDLLLFRCAQAILPIPHIRG